MGKPVVALVGSTGYLGQEIVPIFAKAANDGQLDSFKILAGSKPKDTLTSLVSDKVTIVQVDYTVQESLENALKGVNVLVSALGVVGTEAAEDNLVRAAVAAGVKVYFPSEWGSDLEISPYPSPILGRKQKHVDQARDAGLKTIVFVIGLFSELILSPVFGFWTPPNILNIPDAGHHRVAFTSKNHIVQYALRAVILAFEDPTNFPDKIRVWDDDSTWDDYAKAIEESLGGSSPIIHRNVIPKDQLKTNYDTQPSIAALAQLLTADDLYDYTLENHNELLNPGEKYFKRQSIAEHFKEVPVTAH